jgi:hypothetical protein
VAVLLAIALLVAPAAAPARCMQPAPPEPGFRMLFDGTAASVAGWRHAGRGRFRLTRRCTLRSAGGLGLLWHERRLPRRHVVRVEWRVRGDDNSGVFVGFPAPGDDARVAVDRGYEIQIDATDVPEATTGAIYGVQAPDLARRDRALEPPGRWNTFAIRVDPPRIVVRLNGTVVNRFASGEASTRLAHGRVGLQNHGAGDRVEFRTVQVRRLGP